jgi:hypothetical protein
LIDTCMLDIVHARGVSRASLQPQSALHAHELWQRSAIHAAAAQPPSLTSTTLPPVVKPALRLNRPRNVTRIAQTSAHPPAPRPLSPTTGFSRGQEHRLTPINPRTPKPPSGQRDTTTPSRSNRTPARCNHESLGAGSGSSLTSTPPSPPPSRFSSSREEARSPGQPPQLLRQR